MSEFASDSFKFILDSSSSPCTISSKAISNSSTFSKWSLSGKKESYKCIFEERKEILNSRIISLWVVTTEPLKQVKPASESFDAIRQILPSWLGGAKLFLHLSAYLLIDKGGVLIEYGNYSGQCVPNHFAHYYIKGIDNSNNININGDGMHYYKLNPRDYFSEKLNINYGLEEEELK